MIDTVVLTMPSGSYVIFEPNKFTPSYNLLKGVEEFGGQTFIACKQNPTKSDLKAGNYLPRLTITKRYINGRYDLPMKIEFSVPKLLLLNNFEELVNNDFDAIIEVLKVKLRQMGVGIFEHNLRSAMVSAVHYSKNIIFTDGTTASMIVRMIEKVDLTRRLDLSKSDFRNSGHLVKFHANSYEVTFYDKKADFEQSMKSEKRALENDNLVQLDLFKKTEEIEMFECFRIEIRLTRAKIRQLFKTLAKDTELTFENLFNSELSLKVLKHYWKMVEQEILWLPRDNSPVKDIFEKIKCNNTIPISKVLELSSCIALTNEVGSVGFQKMIGNQAKVYRIKKELKKLSYPEKSIKSKIVDDVSKALKKYQPVKLKDYYSSNVNKSKV